MTTVYENTAGTSSPSEEQEHNHHSTKNGGAVREQRERF